MWFSSSASEAYGAARRPPCIARPWWLLPLLLALASCGFQLRSSMGNLGEIQQIYLKTANPILREELELYLQAARTQVMHNPQDAEVVITVDHEAFTRQVLSVDPTTGKAREFALTYTAQFSAQGGNGAFLVEPQLVQISRDFIFEETAVIGKSREEDLLRIEMQRDAAQQILRRLAKVEK